MTQKRSILTLSVIAAVALTAERVVGRDGHYATAGEAAFGMTNTDGAIGDRVPVDVSGTTIGTAGGAFSDGDYLEAAANGKLVVQDTGLAVAMALEDAAADGDRVEVLWIGNFPAPAAP